MTGTEAQSLKWNDVKSNMVGFFNDLLLCEFHQNWGKTPDYKLYWHYRSTVGKFELKGVQGISEKSQLDSKIGCPSVTGSLNLSEMVIPAFTHQGLAEHIAWWLSPIDTKLDSMIIPLRVEPGRINTVVGSYYITRDSVVYREEHGWIVTLCEISDGATPITTSTIARSFEDAFTQCYIEYMKVWRDLNTHPPDSVTLH